MEVILPFLSVPTQIGRILYDVIMKTWHSLTLIFILVVAGVYWGLNQGGINQAEEGRVVERPQIDPSSFTREEALSSLAQLENRSIVKFDPLISPVAVSFDDLPEELKAAVVPTAEGEVEVLKSSVGGESYSMHYFSTLALPESHNYLIRATGKLFQISTGSRVELASTFNSVSENFKIRVSHIAVSEDRSEVFVEVRAIK